jgi:hypothetical protein
MLRSVRASMSAMALTAALAACAGGPAPSGVATLEDPGASGPTASAAAPIDPQEALLAYAECMRENGIPMTDPRLVEGSDGASGGVGFGLEAGVAEIDKATFREADTTCRPHLANVVQEQEGPGLSPEDEERLLTFARCMRDHGVNVPDPLPPGTVIDEQSGSGGKPDPNDPDVAAARAACSGGLPDKVPVGGIGKPGSGSRP